MRKFSTEPCVAWVTATSPGTPQLPPCSQGGAPSGFEIALAITPPISKKVPEVAAAPMRKNRVSCACENPISQNNANVKMAITPGTQQNAPNFVDIVTPAREQFRKTTWITPDCNRAAPPTIPLVAPAKERRMAVNPECRTAFEIDPSSANHPRLAGRMSARRQPRDRSAEQDHLHPRPQDQRAAPGQTASRDRMHLPNPAIRNHLILLTETGQSGQFVEQRFRFLEVGGVPAFGKPAVDRHEQFTGFGPAELGEAHGSAQFPHLGLLLPGGAQGFPVQSVGGLGIALAQQQLALVAIQLRSEPALAGPVDRLQGLVHQGLGLFDLPYDLICPGQQGQQKRRSQRCASGAISDRTVVQQRYPLRHIAIFDPDPPAINASERAPLGETLLGRHCNQLVCPLTEDRVVPEERKQPGGDPQAVSQRRKMSQSASLGERRIVLRQPLVRVAEAKQDYREQSPRRHLRVDADLINERAVARRIIQHVHPFQVVAGFGKPTDKLQVIPEIAVTQDEPSRITPLMAQAQQILVQMKRQIQFAAVGVIARLPKGYPKELRGPTELLPQLSCTRISLARFRCGEPFGGSQGRAQGTPKFERLPLPFRGIGQ